MSEQTTGLPAGIIRDIQAHVDWLMRERYECIAGLGQPIYPYSKINGGDICEVRHDNCLWHDDVLYTDVNPEHYPHLFKPFFWWQHRTPEQMPGYVKYKSLTTGKIVILKVREWFFIENETPSFNYEWNNLVGYIYTPATAAEYEQFTASNGAKQ